MLLGRESLATRRYMYSILGVCIRYLCNNCCYCSCCWT